MKQHPNFCYSVTEGKSFLRKTNNTRYRYFHQNHYTTGDIEQFLQSWQSLPRKNLNPDQVNMSVEDYYNTLQYIHDKFKKGCLIQIHEGKKKTFLPFSKQNYRNEWGSKIKIDPKFKGDIVLLMKELSEYDSSSPPFDKNKIHRDLHSWYGNNGLVRIEYPLSENDNGYNILDDMFSTLVEERQIPDFDFFLNKRDFPILRKDRKESYVSFFGDNQPLLSHNYDLYAPILSMNSSEEYEDVAIPTWEDWRRVQYWHDKKLFGKDYLQYHTPEELQKYTWDQKIPTVIWRGSSTGLGTTVANNIRLCYYKYALEKRTDIDGFLFLDSEITKWNLRPRKHPSSPYVTTVYKEDFDFKKGSFMSLLDQSQYKYILHLPGHSCAYRLSYEMYSGSVIIMYPSSNNLWFAHLLEPYVHYVPLPIDYDPSVLEKTVRWCKENDEKCREIARNCVEFAHRYLSRNAILDFLAKTLTTLSKKFCLQYSSFSLQTEQIMRGKKNIQQYIQSFRSIPVDLYHKNVWIDKSSYLTYHFLHLKQDKKLEEFFQLSIYKPQFIQSKKTTINLYEHNGQKWIEKISPHEIKRDDINQLFIGYYYINRLAKMSPHFITTIYHEVEKNDQSRIFLEYVEGETLEKLIRSESITFMNLVELWAQLCMAIQQAQDFCGFMHMDMNPWNIIVKPEHSSVFYKKHGMTISSEKTAVLVDYGNSHVSHEGFHFYNTTPFYLNSISDVITMIIGSLDIYLSKITLDSRETKFLFLIMKFVSDCFPCAKTFTSIHQIKKFLKQNRNFSTMLCNNRILKEKKPFEFVKYLVDTNILRNVSFHTTNKNILQTSPLTSLHYPHFFFPFLLQLEFLQQIQTSSCNINKNDFCILFRRLLIQFKKSLKLVTFQSETQKKYCHYIIHDFIHRYGIAKDMFQKQFGRNIWLNHDLKTFLYFLDDYPLTSNLVSESKVYCDNMLENSTQSEVPCLRTHICPEKNRKMSGLPNEFFNHLDILYLFSPKNDLFHYRNQIKNDFISKMNSVSI
jgi:hypothetical protein